MHSKLTATDFKLIQFNYKINKIEIRKNGNNFRLNFFIQVDSIFFLLRREILAVL